VTPLSILQADALVYNTTANYKMAHSYEALESNTNGANNTANGVNALNKTPPEQQRGQQCVCAL
jgi:hypothetical protein